MEQKKILLVWFFLCLGCFLFSRPLYLYSQFRDADEDRFSLEKTGAAEIIGKASGGQNKDIYEEKEIKYVAGADKQWFTADDEVYHYFLTERDKKGRMLKRSCYTTGKDSLIFTPDDALQEYQVYVYNKQQKADGEVVYGKDSRQKYRVAYEYDPRGNKSRDVRYNNAKEIIYYTEYEYDTQGRMVKDVEYGGRGADNKWFSSDDQLVKYHKSEFDGQGKLLRVREYHLEHNGRGEDDVWFSADDAVYAAKELFYNELAGVIKTKKYIGAGPDNRWFSGDDILQYYTVPFEAPDGKMNDQS
jgi:hypothetical protein